MSKIAKLRRQFPENHFPSENLSLTAKKEKEKEKFFNFLFVFKAEIRIENKLLQFPTRRRAKERERENFHLLKSSSFIIIFRPVIVISGTREQRRHKNIFSLLIFPKRRRPVLSFSLTALTPSRARKCFS